MLVDREAVKKVIYGRAGRVTRQFPQRPREVRLEEHDLGIQHRKGVQAAGGRRLEGRRGRHPREGRQEAEAPVPDRDQRPAPEDPGHRQAGLPEGRHRRRAEIGGRLGVLLLRRRQSRHLRQILRRPRDVPDPDEPAGSGPAHAPLSFAQRRHQGEQVAGREFPALGQQGLRRGDRRRRGRDRSRQARRALHQGQRHHDAGHRVHPGDAPPEGGSRPPIRCARWSAAGPTKPTICSTGTGRRRDNRDGIFPS